MNKLISILCVLGLCVSVAQAEQGAVLDTQNRGYFVTNDGYAMTIGSSGTGGFKILGAGTPVAVVDSSGVTFQAGKGLGYSVNSPVFIATPVAATNKLLPGLNVVPATATANTAAFIGEPTPVVGATYDLYNGSASTVRIKAAGGSTLNGATGGGYLQVLTKCRVSCTQTAAGNVACSVPACPTPEGP
jgi:hypothetical protein